MAISFKFFCRKITKFILPGIISLGLFICIYTHSLSINSSRTDVNPTPSDEMSLQLKQSLKIIERFERNKLTMKKVCSERGKSLTLDKTSLKNIYVNDIYKTIYCEVPKVACTNWKRVLLYLSGKLDANHSLTLKSSDVHSSEYGQYLTTLDEYTEEDQLYRLNHYFKFIIVREPLERILSAYRNKFTMKYNQYFNQRYGRDIIEKFRKNPTSRSLAKGDDVTFKEFLQYIVDPDTPRPFNDHWKEYHSICQPCYIDYDIIGKYEFLNEESDYIMRQIGVNVKFPGQSGINMKHASTSSILKEYYGNISTKLLQKVYQIYDSDYAMFGYVRRLQFG